MASSSSATKQERTSPQKKKAPETVFRKPFLSVFGDPENRISPNHRQVLIYTQRPFGERISFA